MKNENLTEELKKLRILLFTNKVSQKRVAAACKIAPTYLNNLLTGAQTSISFEKFSQIKTAAENIIKERNEKKCS